MPVYTLNPLEDRRWDRFVRGHPSASIFHTPGWVHALQRSYGYEPVVFTTARPGVELTNGILVCRVASWLTGRRLVSVPFADHCEPLVSQPQERAEVLRALRAAAADCTHVELRPRTCGPWEELGLEPAASYMFHHLDLRPPLDEVFRGFHKGSTQRKIGRANREGVSCREGQSEDLLQAFYRLMVLTRRRHGVLPQPIQWFKNLMNCVGDCVKIRVALMDGHAIGSIMTLQHGRTLVYKYGGSDARFHRLGAMPLLFWSAIQDAKAAGLEVLDLGRSDLDNPGLIAFKERLGAVSFPLTYVRSSGARHRNGRWPVGLPGRMMARLPDALFVGAGNLLYRHFG